MRTRSEPLHAKWMQGELAVKCVESADILQARHKGLQKCSREAAVKHDGTDSLPYVSGTRKLCDGGGWG